MGLQYLADRPELNRDRGKIFDEIVAGKITAEQAEASVFYKKIEERVHFLPLFPRATSQATACSHLATAARVKYPAALLRCKFDAP